MHERDREIDDGSGIMLLLMAIGVAIGAGFVGLCWLIWSLTP